MGNKLCKGCILQIRRWQRLGVLLEGDKEEALEQCCHQKPGLAPNTSLRNFNFFRVQEKQQF